MQMILLLWLPSTAFAFLGSSSPAANKWALQYEPYRYGARDYHFGNTFRGRGGGEFPGGYPQMDYFDSGGPPPPPPMDWNGPPLGHYGMGAGGLPPGPLNRLSPTNTGTRAAERPLFRGTAPVNQWYKRRPPQYLAQGGYGGHVRVLGNNPTPPLEPSFNLQPPAAQSASSQHLGNLQSNTYAQGTVQQQYSQQSNQGATQGYSPAQQQQYTQQSQGQGYSQQPPQQPQYSQQNQQQPQYSQQNQQQYLQQNHQQYSQQAQQPPPQAYSNEQFIPHDGQSSSPPSAYASQGYIPPARARRIRMRNMNNIRQTPQEAYRRSNARYYPSGMNNSAVARARNNNFAYGMNGPNPNIARHNGGRGRYQTLSDEDYSYGAPEQQGYQNQQAFAPQQPGGYAPHARYDSLQEPAAPPPSTEQAVDVIVDPPPAPGTGGPEWGEQTFWRQGAEQAAKSFIPGPADANVPLSQIYGNKDKQGSFGNASPPPKPEPQQAVVEVQPNKVKESSEATKEFPSSVGSDQPVHSSSNVIAAAPEVMGMDALERSTSEAQVQGLFSDLDFPLPLSALVRALQNVQDKDEVLGNKSKSEMPLMGFDRRERAPHLGWTPS